MKYLVSAALKEPFRGSILRHFEIHRERAEKGESFEDGDWMLRVVTDSTPKKVIGIIDTDKSRIMKYVLDYEPVAKFKVTPVFDYGEARELARKLTE